MGFESYRDEGDDMEIVLFENGTLGYIGDSDKTYLRGGSDYVPIYNNVTDIRSAPGHSKSAFDADGGGDIDREEFWKGLQVFTDAVKASAKLKYPPRPEHALHTNVR